MSKSLVEMTAEIIQAQMANKEMSAEDLKESLKDTFGTLQELQNAEVSNQAVNEGAEKVNIDPAKSIQRNKIICLECGQEFKQLSPKHLKSHGLTSKEYKQKYGFKARQPLCAKSLSEKRSKSGKARGIPDNLKKAIAARTKNKK
jgi:predicted transcriptional regulator